MCQEAESPSACFRTCEGGTYLSVRKEGSWWCCLLHVISQIGTLKFLIQYSFDENDIKLAIRLHHFPKTSKTKIDKTFANSEFPSLWRKTEDYISGLTGL